MGNYEEVNFYINNEKNTITLSHPRKNNHFVYDETNPKAYSELEGMFQELASFEIKGAKNTINKAKVVKFKSPDGDIKATFNNYDAFKKKEYFKKLRNRISNFEVNKYAERKKKIISGCFIAGSLVTAATAITINASQNTEAATYSNIDIDNSLDNKELYITPDSIEIEEIDVDELENTSDNSTINIPITDEMEIIEIPNEILENNTSLNEENTIEDTKNTESENLDFSELKNCQNYDDYIKFASKMYYLDYETAKQVVEENMPNFYTPKKDVTGYDFTTLDRIKDLRDKGIITGDFILPCIFTTLHDYAYNQTDLGSLPAIKTDITNEEIEQGIIDFATYGLGITDKEVLNTFLSVHNLETRYQQDEEPTEKNNVGCNMTDGILNEYRDIRLGIESFDLSFLKILDMGFNSEYYNPSNTIIETAGISYCDPSDVWIERVTNLSKEQYIEDALNRCLGNNKTR